MSEPRQYDGIAHVAQTGPQGMITLRGDLSAKTVKTAATKAAGAAMPGVNEIKMAAGRGGLAWMSPDELLLLCPADATAATLKTLHDGLGTSYALAVDVSDARAMFRLSGPSAREVLAKLCPVDLSPATFAPGQIRRTRMAQVPAAFWLRDDETFEIVCFRSVADYVFSLLKVAAQPGSEVGYF